MMARKISHHRLSILLFAIYKTRLKEFFMAALYLSTFYSDFLAPQHYSVSKEMSLKMIIA